MTTHPMRLGKLARKRNFIFKSRSEVKDILDKMEYPKFRVKPEKAGFMYISVPTEQVEWCHEVLGTNFYIEGDTIWFSNQQHLAWYMLRWA